MNVFDRLRADQRAHSLGEWALLLFLVVPLAAGVLLGWFAAVAIYGLVWAFAAIVAWLAR
jgi:hypothetical protein